MLVARVVGSVVLQENTDRVRGGIYRVVRPADASGSAKGSDLVALDLVGADRGDVVLVSQGSSARQTAPTGDAAIDAVVVGIVDRIDVEAGRTGYHAD